MGQTTGIGWTDHTFNPWMGCARVSPACGGAKGVGGCYAEALVTGRMGYNAESADPRRRLTLWGPPSTSTRLRTSAANWRNPVAWDAAAKRDGVRRRIFCASLADVFEDHPDLPAVRADLWPLIERCDGLDWQLLTKRPENIRAMVPPSWLAPGGWPAHAWAGTTVEDQKRAAQRIPHLLAVPARVRFLSCEPLLEAVDLDPPLCPYCRDGGEVQRVESKRDTHFWCVRCDSEAVFGNWLDACASEKQPGISWVIVGGESGPGSRAFDVAWARSIVAQCDAAAVPVFVKQLGARPIDGDLVEVLNASGLAVAYRRPPSDPDGLLAEARAKGRVVRAAILDLDDRAGADPDEWPNELRVREFPKAVTR
jgi:protein gp37